MRIIIAIAVLFFFTSIQANAYVANKTLINRETDSRYSELPPYLRYPNDTISEMMFKGKIKKIINFYCNYRFMLYTGVAAPNPEVESLTVMKRIITSRMGRLRGIMSAQ